MAKVVLGTEYRLQDIIEKLADAVSPPPECKALSPPPKATEWQAECDGRTFRFSARRLCESREDVCPEEAETLAALVADVEKFYRELLKDPEYLDFICDRRASREDAAFCHLLKTRGPRPQVHVGTVMVPPGDRDTGMGSAGIGGAAKVFLSPVLQDVWFGIDNVYVVVHELHHVHGSGSELDHGSELAALAYHLARGNRFNTRNVDWELSSKALVALQAARRSEHRDMIHSYRKMVRFLYGRYPEEFEAALRRAGWSEADVEFFRNAVKKWKPGQL
jgi:hypothetical protein